MGVRQKSAARRTAPEIQTPRVTAKKPICKTLSGPKESRPVAAPSLDKVLEEQPFLSLY